MTWDRLNTDLRQSLEVKIQDYAFVNAFEIAKKLNNGNGAGMILAFVIKRRVCFSIKTPVLVRLISNAIFNISVNLLLNTDPILQVIYQGLHHFSNFSSIVPKEEQ